MSPRVIQVAVPRPLHSVYDYEVPADLAMPKPGARVRVPFGRSVTVGVCVETDVASPHEKLKAVTELLDDAPVVEAEVLGAAIQGP